MKNQIFKTTLLFIALAVFTSCDNDDETAPVNDEEVITTATITLTPAGGGTAIVLQSQDLDGEGGNAPTVTVSGDLVASTTYSGAIVLLNETESPAENITVEVIAEADEHQFFFTTTGGLNVATTYSDFDGNNNPLGSQFELITTAASTGVFTVTLRHQPTKPNTGLTDAGGETDIEVSFDVTIM